jgi:hypothetical protein
MIDVVLTRGHPDVATPARDTLAAALRALSMNTPFRNLQTTVLVLLPVLALTILVGEAKWVEPLFIHGAYYFLLALVLAWLAVHLTAATSLTRQSLLEWIKENRAGVLIALSLTAVIALAVAPALRVLADETNLLGTSRSLYFNKTATFTVSGRYYYDNFWDAGTVIDRRPLLFPFLVSLVHLLRGYSYTNTFLLNLIALAAFLLLSYRLAKSLGGEAFGVAAAFLVVAHPITLVSLRSGGFDFLAAVLSLAVIKSFLDHCRAPSADRLAMLWMNLCMFAEVRYETALFVAPVVVVLLAFRLAKLEYLRPYRLIYSLTPVFLLPRIWQAILRGNVPEQDPGAITFSAVNLQSNVRDYLRTLLAPHDLRSGHSALVIALGIVGAILAVRWIIEHFRERARPELRFGVLVAAWTTLQLLIVLTYVWGRPSHPASARLFISIDTLFSFLAAWAVAASLRRWRPWFATFACAALFAIAVPVAAEARLLNELTLTREASTVWRFFESLHEKRILIVAERPGLFTVMDYGAVGYEDARKDPSVLAGFEQHLYCDVYVVDQINAATKRPLPQYELWPERPRQTMLEFLNDGGASVRISRLLR